jgi:hypothetical protein
VHYGVTTVAINDPRIIGAESTPITAAVRVSGRLDGTGSVYLLRDTGQEALLEARYRLEDFSLRIAEEPFHVGSQVFPAGSWILPPRDGLDAVVAEVAHDLALDFHRVASAPDVPQHDAPAPRLAVWVPWADTDSIGWLRYTLDQRGIPYDYLRDEDVRAGDLRQRFDVIVYGNVDLDLEGQIHGIPATSGPLPFEATEEYPNLGRPVSSDDITGGPGWAGLAALDNFVEEGGVLMTLGNGSTLVLDGGMVRNVRRSTGAGISTPGAELMARFPDPGHPLAYGYAETTSVFRANYPVYDLPRRWLRMAYCTACLDGPVDTRGVVLQWGTMLPDAAGQVTADSGPMVVSGGARNEGELHGRPAILAVPAGEGLIVAYNFNPMHRDLNRSDYRLLWNGILNWQAVKRRRGGDEE